MMLQCGPLFEVRKAGAHIAGFQPGIATTLAAGPADFARVTSILSGRFGLVDGLLEERPALPHGASAQIVFRSRKRHAEVHLAIGCDGKTTPAARARNEGLPGEACVWILGGSRLSELARLERGFQFRSQPIGEWCCVSIGSGMDIEAVLKLESAGFHERLAGIDLCPIDRGHRHADRDRECPVPQRIQSLKKMGKGALHSGHRVIRIPGGAVDRGEGV